MPIPTLEDYEYQFGDEGVLLNPTAAGAGATYPFFDVEKVSGLDSPEFRTATRTHEGVDGGYVDSEFMNMRTVVLEGTLFADPTDADTMCDQLRYDFRPVVAEQPFYFKHPNKPVRVVFGKGQGVRYDIEQLRNWGSTECQATLVCPVPYIYTAEEVINSGDLGGADTGHGFNHAYNLGFGGNNNYDGSAAIFNAGNHNAYPVVVIYGPIINPGLQESATGKTLLFDIELGTSDYLEIDTRRHRVTLNGSVSRRETLISGPRSWWWIPPGESTVTLLGSPSMTQRAATSVLDSTTSDYIEVITSDAGDIVVGDTCHLYASTQLLKQTTIFTVTSKVAVGSNTQIFFTPNAAVVTVVGDILKAGTAFFTVTMRSTFY